MQPLNKRLVTEATAPSHVATALTTAGASKTALDNAIGTQITTPGTPAAVALAASYAPARRAVYGPRWVFDGDSITINGIAETNGNQDRARSWTSEMVRLSMGRINYVFNAAVAGQKTDDALARFDAFVAPKTPDVVFLTAGTNDVGASRTPAEWLAFVSAYYDKVKAIGADLILGAVWPSDNNTPAGRSATTRTYNTALYDWAAARGIQVVGWDTLADPVTGGWPAGWSSDQLHPGLLDSYAVIGKFGWQSVEPKTGPPIVRRAVSNGADALPNGFFTTLAAPIGVPNLTAGTPDTVSGTLPAGTYSYKYTARTYWGEGLPSAERVVVLAGTGKITLTNSTVTGSRGYQVYRKGPGDSTWKSLAFVSGTGTTTYVDTGAVAPGADMAGVDTSPYPTGLVAGNTIPHQLSPVTTTEAGVRGRIFRLLPYETGTASANDHFAVSVVAGETYAASALVRSTGTTEGIFVVRFRNGANANIGQVFIARDRMVNGFGLAHQVITIPAEAVTARISFEHTDGTSTGYVEYAEVQFRKL